MEKGKNIWLTFGCAQCTVHSTAQVERSSSNSLINKYGTTNKGGLWTQTENEKRSERTIPGVHTHIQQYIESQPAKSEARRELEVSSVLLSTLYVGNLLWKQRMK